MARMRFSFEGDRERRKSRLRWFFACAFAFLGGCLLVGCGGGGGGGDDDQQSSHQPMALKGNQASAQGQRKGKPSGKQSAKKQSAARNLDFPSQPKGIEIAPLPEDEFTIVGNVDEFSIPDHPLQPAGDVIAVVPDAGFGSADFDIVGNRATGRRVSGHLRGNFRGNLPGGFLVIRGGGFSPEGFPWRILCRKDGAVMSLIPAGVTIRGITGGPPEAGPEHLTYLETYYIDVHEVTIGQYEAYRKKLRKGNKSAPSPLKGENDSGYPATGLMWGEAVKYARWAGKSLPREAEWEKAARGPDGLVFPWGKGKPIWHLPRVPGQIDHVETFRGDCSRYGVMDLAGNAREWCQDWYSPTAYEDEITRAGTTTLRSPKGPRAAVGSKDRTVRVVRGSREGWEAWRRAGAPMGKRAPDIGFRCVLRLFTGRATKTKGRATKTKNPSRKTGF